MRRTLCESEHELFRPSVRAFLVSEVVPDHERRERDGNGESTMFRESRARGLLGMGVPEEYGRS